MNKQASTAMWTAGAVAAALLLGACGSGDDSQDEIKGAGDSKPSKSAPASDSKSSAPRGDERPQYKLAEDAKNVFEDTKTGDPKKDEVVADNQRRINLTDRIVTTGKDADDLKLYAKGQAFIAASKYISTYADDDYSWAGTARYYNHEVEFLNGATAKITYCVDDSKANDKNLKTGKVERYDSGDGRDTLETSTVRRSKDKIWQSYSSRTKREAEECER
ncbi:hypothetical protein DTL70_16265 [Streptomyces diacarni]|uniref:Lipoprotein n=1 Tax=Streptomyces diacarni TaxID=2800381 RepID=A0A367EWR4_9ACTN|nr:hypothetical protein [Streptomyces diacarni]RCG22025.1 hypothetical protein DTL70_16265 [Streptomyces diacarni]